MKNLFLAVCLMAMLSSPVVAVCNGGTEFTVDGDTFCISDIRLNWWSASNWCQANGMHLATIYEVCPDWDGNGGSGKCGRTFSTVSTYCWTATASGSEQAFYVEPSLGNVSMTHRQGNLLFLCTN